MHLIDGQAQIQWSVALQLSLCGHLATALTKCTLQLSLSGYSAEAWANEAWAKVAAKSLTLPSRPQSAALALITQPLFSAVAQMCVRVRAHGSLEVLVTSMPLMLREALRLVYEVFMVTPPPNNTGAGLRLLLQVILGNALLLLEAEL